LSQSNAGALRQEAAVHRAAINGEATDYSGLFAGAGVIFFSPNLIKKFL